MPIAYYIFQRKFDAKYITKSSNRSDRDAIRVWLIRSLLKASGIWGSGLDTLLTDIRGVITNHGSEGFPIDMLQEVMVKRGKSLAFATEEVDELSEMQYGDKRLFPLLTLLFPFVDVTNHHFHIDHVFPYSRFSKSKLKIVGVPDSDVDELMEMANCLPNLQLLEGAENIEKQASMPADWMGKHLSKAAHSNYCDNHLLGDMPTELTDFRKFYESRRKVLRARIVKILAANPDEADSV